MLIELTFDKSYELLKLYDISNSYPFVVKDPMFSAFHKSFSLDLT